MKKFFYSTSFIVLLSSSLFGNDVVATPTQRIGTVNLRRCVEESLLGKKEQNELESIKKRYTKSIGKLEEELTSIYNKLQDEEYMEGLSSTACDELKKEFDEKSAEYQALMGQFQQELSQKNTKCLQQLFAKVKDAANTVCKNENLDVVLNDEAVLAISSSYDRTDAIIKILDESFQSN